MRVVGNRPAVHDHHVGAVRVEQLEVLERIAVDHEQISDVALSHLAESILHADHPRPVPRGVFDHFDGLEARFFVQLEFPGDPEAVQ